MARDSQAGTGINEVAYDIFGEILGCGITRDYILAFPLPDFTNLVCERTLRIEGEQEVQILFCKNCFRQSQFGNVPLSLGLNPSSLTPALTVVWDGCSRLKSWGHPLHTGPFLPQSVLWPLILFHNKRSQSCPFCC